MPQANRWNPTISHGISSGWRYINKNISLRKNYPPALAGVGVIYWRNNNIMDLLKKLYYDERTGFQSGNKLYDKAKVIDANITHNLVDEFLDNQATAQITKQVHRNKVYHSILSPSVRNNYQIDLMYLPNPRQNKNYKYLLTCMDVYSRYAFVAPLKNKTGAEVFEAIQELFDENGMPKNINSDLGTEFIYRPFKDYCERNGIELWFSDTEQENKNAIIERFHRTLRGMILRYEVAFGKSYIDDLQSLIWNYNHTKHSTTNQQPIEIWEGKNSNNQKINIIPNHFVVGERVRHLVKKKVFDKSSDTTTYTKTVYTITEISGQSVYLDDLKKPYRPYELIIANSENDNEDQGETYDKRISHDKKQMVFERKMRREGIDWVPTSISNNPYPIPE